MSRGIGRERPERARERFWMYVRFWGTRGSIATPGPQTAYYGGNTSCVEVRADDGTLIILDCGTGARELGLHLLRGERRPLHLHLFIGHTHWDHIQGFLFGSPGIPVVTGQSSLSHRAKLLEILG
jgi:phosphoribosyl 1,2-cyclic phosphodiesterase